MNTLKVDIQKDYNSIVGIIHLPKSSYEKLLLDLQKGNCYYLPFDKFFYSHDCRKLEKFLGVEKHNVTRYKIIKCKSNV